MSSQQPSYYSNPYPPSPHYHPQSMAAPSPSNSHLMAASTGNGNSGGGGEGGGGGSGSNSRQPSLPLRTSKGKRARQSIPDYDLDDEEDDELFDDDVKPGKALKPKVSRGSRACTVCRKLKMRCVGAEIEPPCKRCKAGNHDCVFEESQRGRRSTKKSTDSAASKKAIKKMAATFETVLDIISQPGAAAVATGGMLDSPSSYSHQYNDSMSPEVISPVNIVRPLPAMMPGEHQPRYHPQQPMAGSSTSTGSTGDDGIRLESGLGRQGMQWNAWNNRHGHEDGREGPRLHSLPDNTLNPLGLLAEASLQNSRKYMQPSAQSMHPESVLPPFDIGNDETSRSQKAKLGVANHGYFQPGPMNILPLRRIVIEQRMPPALLVEKIVTVDEVVELFALFFSHCHRGAPFLDPAMHTPTATGSRSPFLFTCICAVAARYYTKRTDDLYRKCLATAKRIAFDVMARGFKSVEIIQGFLLLCHWNQPAERFEEDRTWSFSGAAFRMATDLNLHRKTVPNLPDDMSEETRILYEREILNRERCWYYCFICDSSLSAQMGKPSSIAKEDFLIRNAKTWYQQSASIKTDVGLSAMVEMHRLVSRMLDTLYSDTRTISGLNVHLDYPLLMRGYLSQIDQWRSDWTTAIPVDFHDPGDLLRLKMREFYAAYYRLFLLSFAVQHALDTPEQTINLTSYCALSFEAATRIIKIARDYLGPNGVLRFGIDSTYVYLSYAATFLLKLISPAFARFVDESLVIALVRDLASCLESCAVDDSHTPALYASFLRALIDSKLNGGRTAPVSRAASPGIHTTGLESFVRSRANSVGPAAVPSTSTTTGVSGNHDANGTVPLGPPGAATGEMGGEGSNGSSSYAMANHNATMESMLNTTGFWDNMLMPGFGNTNSFGGLSGGGMLSGGMDSWAMTPLHSVPGSPSAAQFGFEFNSH